MTPARVRTALPIDVSALTGLSIQLGYPSLEDEIHQRLQVLTGRPENLLLVAELDEGVVGWVHAFVAYRLESPPFVEIGGLVVDQHHRSAGIGRRLVTEVVHWAKGMGFTQIRVRSNVVREATHGFYLQLGFSISKAQYVFAMTTESN
jgi:GNAT superfamily N-acetyltransferase